MTITHEGSIRDTLCNTVVDTMDAGGVLRYQTGAAATVADGTLSTPAFGAASSGTATANAIGDATNTTGSTQVVAQFAMRSTTADIFFGSVTQSGGGGDIIITNTSVANNEAIQTNSFTYSAAA